MNSARTPRRRADAARNDELLLQAGLELLREKGPDRLAALDVARRAGLTTGALYARYENNEEILVGLWQKSLREPLRTYFSDTVRMSTGDGSTDDPIRHSLTDPSSPLLAAISLLIATPRITELTEVVIPDVQSMLRDLGVTDDCDDPRSMRILGAVSTALGCLYFAAADMLNIGDWPLIRSWLRFINTDESGQTPLPLEPATLSDLIVDTGDAARDALVNAAAGVIARSGLERATTQRVARGANLPPSTLFSEYGNRQALFADVVVKLLREIYEKNRYRIFFDQISTPADPTVPLSGWDDPRLQAFRDSMVTGVAANVTGLLGRPGLAHRRIRLEFHLAAIHNADVRNELRRVDDSTNGMAIHNLQTMFNLPPAVAEPGTRTSRIIAQGAMLLEDVSHMVSGRDIRFINGPFANFCCSTALGMSTEPIPATTNHR